MSVNQDIYLQVLEKVRGHPGVRGTQRGVLYKIIQIINDEESSYLQEKTLGICTYFNIDNNAYIDEDKKIVHRVLSVYYHDEIIENMLSFLSERGVTINRMNNQKRIIDAVFLDRNKINYYMEWIVLGAVTLVGFFASFQYLKKDGNKDKVRQRESTEPAASIHLPPIPAILSLVVPAYMVQELNIKEGDSVNFHILNELIDKTSYFSCNNKIDSEKNEQNLQIINEPILANSPREVYLRIKIEDGGDLSEKPVTLLYTLKRNLPEQGEFKIEKIACLGKLTGLEKFIRI